MTKKTIPVLLVLLLIAVVPAQRLPADAAAEFMTAVEDFRSGRYAAAAATLRTLEQRFPEDAEVHHLLAIVLDVTQQTEAAGQQFALAVELAPGSARIRANYGTNLMRSNRPEEAIVQLTEAIRLDGTHATARFNLGTIFLQREDYQAALPHLLEAHRLQPQVYQNAYQLGSCYFALGRYKEASEILARLSIDPASRPELQLLTALNQRALGSEEQASTTIQSLVEKIQGDPSIRRQILTMLLSQGMYRESVGLLEIVLAETPSPAIRVELGRAYLAAGRPADAETVLLAALSEQQNADAYTVLGDVYEAQDEPLKAVEAFQRAVAVGPGEATFFALGYEFLIHWNWDSATEVFNRGLASDPDSWRLWIGLGSAALGRNQPEEATTAFLKAIEVDPDAPMSYALLAQSFVEIQSNFGPALAAFRGFRQRHPESPQAIYFDCLARFQSSLRKGDQIDFGEIGQSLSAVANAFPEFGDAKLLLGEIEFEQGHWEEAARWLQLGIESDPENVQAHYKLGLSQRRLGNSEEAKKTLATYQRLKTEQEQAMTERVSRTTKFIVDLKNP